MQPEKASGQNLLCLMHIPFPPLIPLCYVPLAAAQRAPPAPRSGILFALLSDMCRQVPSNCFRRGCLALGDRMPAHL